MYNLDFFLRTFVLFGPEIEYMQLSFSHGRQQKRKGILKKYCQTLWPRRVRWRKSMGQKRCTKTFCVKQPSHIFHSNERVVKKMHNKKLSNFKHSHFSITMFIKDYMWILYSRSTVQRRYEQKARKATNQCIVSNWAAASARPRTTSSNPDRSDFSNCVP